MKVLSILKQMGFLILNFDRSKMDDWLNCLENAIVFIEGWTYKVQKEINTGLSSNIRKLTINVVWQYLIKKLCL